MQPAESARRSFGAEFPMYIGGETVTCQEKMTEHSPIDSTITIGKFQSAAQAKFRRGSVCSRREAFAEWSGLDYTTRVSIFRKAADLFAQRKFDFAATLSYENGKTQVRIDRRG